MDPWWNLALVFLFVLIGGVFSGTEIALVSLRESQVRAIEQTGPRGRRVASVARDPNRFLAAVQIGVTVAGFLSAAYGASTLAPTVAPWFEAMGLSASAADTTALLTLTLAVAYLSLVLGELVPKRIALQQSARVSLLVAPPLDRFATLMTPVIWLLSRSTNGVVRIFGGDPQATEEQMSSEEVRDVVMAHEGLPADERRILGDVFEARDRSVTEVMHPRGEVEFVAGDLTLTEAVEAVRGRQYSRYPVTGEDFDDILGFLHVRDLLEAVGTGTFDAGARVRDIAREIAFLPGTNGVLPSMTELRRARVHIAIVVDEYGGTDGIVTLEDLVEELVGEIHDEYDIDAVAPARAGVGEYAVDARLTIEECAERSGLVLPDGPYETVAGYVVARLGHLAAVGDQIEGPDGERIVVSGVTGRRVTEVTVLR